jgi:molecular chaperone DnaJ
VVRARPRSSTTAAPCPDCDGRGEVSHRDRIKVQIPPGIEDGTALRIPGRGMPAPAPSGVAGDAYVIVEAAADPRFVRHGADLWHAEEIEAPDAVLGTDRLVPTLEGEVKLTIPPGTQPGTTLRIQGKGLPRFGSPGEGDLYVRDGVRIPERVGSADRRLWERLRKRRPG